LFNRPNPARPTKVWHPNPGVLSDDAARGFTTSRWHNDQTQGFANDTFGSHDSGFTLDQYPASNDALSESAQRAFSLLDDVKKQHALAKKALEEQEAASANAHLPFVLDVYEAPEPKRVVAAEPVAPSTLTDAVDASETQATDAAHAEGDADEHAALTDAETVASELPKVADAAASFEETQDESAQASLHAAAQVADAPAPAEAVAAAPVIEGVPHDEVAEREAAHFAQGMAQGLEQGMAQGLEQGLAQGIEQGLAQGLEQGLAEGREQGMKEGLALAEEQAREAQALAEQEVTAKNEVMAEVSAKLNALLEDPTQFFEPLKRLALHLAEQVVKCELRTSGHAIEQLVQRCLDDLDHPAKGAVVVELNPEDKARLQADGGALIQGMRLDAVHDMKPGSVRVFANDMIVEDLVEHRLEALARTMLIDVDSWRKQSVLAKPEALEVAEASAEDVIEEAADVHP
jgi:flagellar biosynthesis/type III secretory pathway protein FliH